MDVSFDLHKPEGWHDEFCTQCHRSDAALSNCDAADCYASFCGKHATRGKKWKGMYVCPMCYRRKARIGSAFRAGTHDASSDKALVNRMFSDAVVRTLGENAHEVGVLALDCAQTAKALARAVPRRLRPRMRLVVPNPNPDTVESLERVSMELARAGMRVDVHPTRLGDFLTTQRGEGNTRFSCVFADFCSSYDGNAAETMFPRHDMRKLWEHALDRRAKKVFVGYTFCKRMQHTTCDRVLQEQIDTAALHGWRARLLKRHDYGNMHFSLLEATSEL